mmetsp:Transcript_34622/g.99462  ORF Transcript_34622/g.99462 Transcript_34622/m.99462 type:complete len:227 (-) Transcript_34622:296-976(-)
MLHASAAASEACMSASDGPQGDSVIPLPPRLIVLGCKLPECWLFLQLAAGTGRTTSGAPNTIRHVSSSCMHRMGTSLPWPFSLCPPSSSSRCTLRSRPKSTSFSAACGCSDWKRKASGVRQPWARPAPWRWESDWSTWRTRTADSCSAKYWRCRILSYTVPPSHCSVTRLMDRKSSKTSRTRAAPSLRRCCNLRTVALSCSCLSAPLGLRTVTKRRTAPVLRCTAE